MAEPLIPVEVRTLYEALLEEGSRITPSTDPMWQEPTVQALLRAGLAFAEPREPSTLAPTMPDTAFAKVLVQWQLATDRLREKIANSHRTALQTQRLDLRARGQRNPNYSCVVIGDRRHVLALQAALYRSAEEQALAFATGPFGEAVRLPSGQEQKVQSLYLPPEPALFARGGRYREIIDDDLLSECRAVAISSFLDGEEIRVVRGKLPTKLQIIDGDTALVALGPYGSPCLLVRDQGIVNALVNYFELKWAEARPWAPPGVPIRKKENSQRQRILEALAAGLKDEAIARQQGVSVRTVRRHITALMQELGVTTRFAAGVAAVRRGWLNPTT